MHDVALAYVHFDTVAGLSLNALADLIYYDATGAQLIGPRLRYHSGSLGVVEGVNKLAAMFLESDAEWIFWIDCDMGFTPDTLECLYRAAKENDLPSLAALAFKEQQTATDPWGGYISEPRPVIMDYGVAEDGSHGFMCRLSYPENTIVQCQATGMACVLIHRSMYEAITEKFGPDRWHTPITSPPECPGSHFGPDVSFWCQAAMAGKPGPFIHTGIGTTHQKAVWASHMTFVRSVGDAWKQDAPTNYVYQEPPKPNRAERRKLAKAGR